MVLHSSGEPGELSPLLHHDHNTVKTLFQICYFLVVVAYLLCFELVPVTKGNIGVLTENAAEQQVVTTKA